MEAGEGVTTGSAVEKGKVGNGKNKVGNGILLLCTLE